MASDREVQQLPTLSAGWKWAFSSVEVPKGADWEKTLEAMGWAVNNGLSYNPSSDYGEPYLMVRGADSQGRYLVEISLSGDGADTVLCADMGCVLDIIARVQPALTGIRQHDTMKYAERWISRAFHAWHGHYPDEPCLDCDPSEVAFQNEMARQRREAKSGNGTAH